MQDTCPTVKVKADNEHGFMLINESDFDPEAHALFDEAIEPDAPKRRGRPAKSTE